MRTFRAFALPIGLLLCLQTVIPAQDSLQLLDGRFITGPKMSRDEEGVTLHLEAGDILIPERMVKETTVRTEGDIDAQLSEADKKKIARGLVKHDNVWMKKAARDRRVEKEAAAVQEKIQEALTHSEWANRYTKTSKHFEFHYTIDPDIMDYWADLMDAYYDAFSKFWGGLRRPAGQGKLEVKFYHNRDYFQQVSGAPPGALGFFRFVPPLELNFYYDRLNEEETMDVMFHEANHYLFWLMAPKYRNPNWLAEGLAEYYAASIWDPKTKKLEVGGLLEGRLAGVQTDIIANRWVTFDDMMPHANIPGQYYGWAWTFVHFMMNSKYEKRFKKMFRALSKDSHHDVDRLNYGTWQMTRHTQEAQKELLKKHLKVKDLNDLQEEWYAYIKQLQPASARGFAESGQNALQNGMPIKATKMFEKAIEMGFESPLMHIYYAIALLNKPKKDDSARMVDYRQAQNHYEQAIDLDPVNPAFRARFAQVLDRIARTSKKEDPNVTTQREFAAELGKYVNGGRESYSVFLSLSNWTPYKPAKKEEEDGDGN